MLFASRQIRLRGPSACREADFLDARRLTRFSSMVCWLMAKISKPNSPVSLLAADAAAWALRAAGPALAGAAAEPFSQDLCNDWETRRDRVGILAASIAKSCMGSLCSDGLFPEVPSVKYDSSQYFLPVGINAASRAARQAQGTIQIGESSVQAWPARVEVAYHEGDEAHAPAFSSPAFRRHLVLRAATFLAGGFAEKIVAKRIAARAVEAWIRESCSDPMLGAGEGAAIRAAFERAALGQSSTPSAPSRKPRRSL